MSYQDCYWYRTEGIDIKGKELGCKIVWRKNLLDLISVGQDIECDIKLPKNEETSKYFSSGCYTSVYSQTVNRMTKQTIMNIICNAIVNKYRGDIFEYVREKVGEKELCYYAYIRNCEEYEGWRKPKEERKTYHNIAGDFTIVDKNYSTGFERKVDEHVEKFGDYDSKIYVSKIDKAIDVLTKNIISSKFKHCFRKGILQIQDKDCPTKVEDVDKYVKTFQGNQTQKQYGIETQIVQNAVRKKKEFGYDLLSALEIKLSDVGFNSWDSHYIKIENSNESITRKFVTKLLFRNENGKLKNNQQIIKMTEQEMMDKVCMYYEDLLTKMLKEITKYKEGE